MENELSRAFLLAVFKKCREDHKRCYECKSCDWESCDENGVFPECDNPFGDEQLELVSVRESVDQPIVDGVDRFGASHIVRIRYAIPRQWVADYGVNEETGFITCYAD